MGKAKSLEGMADKLMTKEQKARADKIRESKNGSGHTKKNGLDK